MSKKIILGAIGFVGVGMLFFAPTTHAATAAPELDLQTRTLLGQTLNVLQVVLNKIDARISDKSNPISNPQEVSASLGGIKSVLITIDSYLKGASPLAGAPGSFPGETSPSPAVNYGTAPSTPQTATVSWFVGPKILLIILPILVLVAVAFSFMRKKEPEEIGAEESAVIASEIKTT
jgi:hypothetical protein